MLMTHRSSGTTPLAQMLQAESQTLALEAGQLSPCRVASTAPVPAIVPLSIVPPGQAVLSLGKNLETSEEFLLREVELKRHVFVVGATGTGKSKFLCLALSMLVRLGRIVVLVDPDGDLCDDVIAWGAAYAAKLGTDAMVRRFHIVEPNPEQMLFHHDPFLYQGSYPFGSFQYHCWLDRRVEDVARTILAYTQLGDIEFGVQKRLERWLKNYLYAAGVALDEKGTHLGMVKALVLLNPHHDHFGATLARVAPFLPPEVREDFERFEHLSNGRVDEILESTTNRLRAVLTTLVRELLSQNVQSIDFDAVVNTPGQVLLVNLQDTDYFSREQANFIGHIVIEEVLARTRSRRGERRQVYLFIDECWRYTSQTIENCLVGHRKYGLSCVLACQHVGKLKRNDLDLRPDVIENCRTIIAFAQTHPDHVELLSRVLGYGNLDFEELYQVVDRPDGYDWEEVEEESMALSRSAGWAKGRSETNTGTDSWGQSRSLTSQESWSDTDSQQQAIASSDSTTDSSGVSNGSTRSQTPLISDQEVQRMIPLAGSQSADQRGSASTASNSLTQTDGQSSTRGGSLAEGRGESLGGSRAEALGTNWQDSGNESISHTVSRKLVPLARHREEWHPTGRLRRAVDDQFYKIGHRLHQLQTRQAMVRPADGGPAVTFQVHEVPQPFATEAYRRAMIENFKSKVFAAHAYNFPAPVDYDPLDQDVEAAPSDTEQPGDNGTAGGSQDDNGNLTANRRDLPQTTSGGAGPNGKPQRPSQNGKTKSNGHTAPRVAREADPFEPK